jgi:hypothetical protein
MFGADIKMDGEVRKGRGFRHVDAAFSGVADKLPALSFGVRLEQACRRKPPQRRKA